MFCKKFFSKSFSKPFLQRVLCGLDCGHFRAPKDWVLVTSTQEHTERLSTSFTGQDNSTSFLNPRYDRRLNLLGCFYRDRKNLTTMVLVVLVNGKLFAKHMDVYVPAVHALLLQNVIWTTLNYPSTLSVALYNEVQYC